MKVVTVGLEELQKIMSDVIKSEVEPIKRLVANNEDKLLAFTKDMQNSGATLLGEVV